MPSEHRQGEVRRWVVPRPGPDGKPVGVLKIEVVPAEAYDRYRTALADLLEEAEDMRSYVPDYFAKKWKHDEALERAREMLAGKDSA